MATVPATDEAHACGSASNASATKRKWSSDTESAAKRMPSGGAGSPACGGSAAAGRGDSPAGSAARPHDLAVSDDEVTAAENVILEEQGMTRGELGPYPAELFALAAAARFRLAHPHVMPGPGTPKTVVPEAVEEACNRLDELYEEMVEAIPETEVLPDGTVQETDGCLNFLSTPRIVVARVNKHLPPRLGHNWRRGLRNCLEYNEVIVDGRIWIDVFVVTTC